MDLYQKIVIARKKKGFTQEELADLTKISVRTVQRIESGESTPRSYTLKTIATALDISFEELNATDSDSFSNSINLSNLSKEENGKHFLEMLCLSCFSYLVIPLVHFLIPAYILKKSTEQNPKIIAFARRIIKVQLYWKSTLLFLLLISLVYNIIRAAYFERSHLLNYLLPFFAMYILNAIIITVNLWRIKRTNFSFEQSV